MRVEQPVCQTGAPGPYHGRREADDGSCLHVTGVSGKCNRFTAWPSRSCFTGRPASQRAGHRLVMELVESTGAMGMEWRIAVRPVLPRPSRSLRDFVDVHHTCNLPLTRRFHVYHRHMSTGGYCSGTVGSSGSATILPSPPNRGMCTLKVDRIGGGHGGWIIVRLSDFLNRFPDAWLQPPADPEHWYPVESLSGLVPPDHLDSLVVMTTNPVDRQSGSLYLVGAATVYRWAVEHPRPDPFSLRPWPFPPLEQRVSADASSTCPMPHGCGGWRAGEEPGSRAELGGAFVHTRRG